LISPPPDLIHDAFQIISKNHPEKLSDYLDLYSSVDGKGRYLHFDKFRYKVPKELDTKLAWSMVKMARNRQLTHIIDIGSPLKQCKFQFTPTIQKALSETDKNTSSAALEWMSNKIGENQHFEYLLNDLREDEAISSSQLEGAATTTKVAKDLLKRKRKARTPDEKMIIGNYKMMHFAWENRHKDLSIEFISELHQVGVEGINDDEYHPGEFRKDDDVHVVDGEGNIVHTPPPSKGLSKRMKELVEWANTCHDDADSSEYVHPLIKAATLHFVIGYEHPFRDGNGRVARSIFYWYMFKKDYAAFRYIAISLLLKTAPVQYGKSYLYTETDEMDLTYFLDYQCGIIIRAISNFKTAFQKTWKDIEQFNEWLFNSGLYKKLNAKQRTVFQVAKAGIAQYFTASNVKENLGCSYNTALTVLNGLVKLGLFQKKKSGREWVFSMKSPLQPSPDGQGKIAKVF
jgi:Fic family protein